MGRRKGEMSSAQIDRRFPHQVILLSAWYSGGELPAGARILRGLVARAARPRGPEERPMALCFLLFRTAGCRGLDAAIRWGVVRPGNARPRPALASSAGAEAAIALSTLNLATTGVSALRLR